MYVDHGLAGANGSRPDLWGSMAAVRTGEVLVVAKLDRLARSLPCAREIAPELTPLGVTPNIGRSVHDPVGRLLLRVLSMGADSEAHRLSTREGMAAAKENGRLGDKKPKFSPSQKKHLVSLHRGREITIADIAERFGASRSTVCRAIQRARASSPRGLPEGKRQLAQPRFAWRKIANGSRFMTGDHLPGVRGHHVIQRGR